jgi:hypothetical protein
MFNTDEPSGMVVPEQAGEHGAVRGVPAGSPPGRPNLLRKDEIAVGDVHSVWDAKMVPLADDSDR